MTNVRVFAVGIRERSHSCLSTEDVGVSILYFIKVWVENGQLRIKNVFHVKDQKGFLNDNIVNMEEN